MDFSASQVLFNASSLKLVKFLTLCCMYSWEKECISYKYVRCVPKIWSLTIKEICEFFTLKMLPMALELIRAQNLFDLFVKNCTHFTREIIMTTKFSCKVDGFLPMSQKGGVFVFWSMLEPLETFQG